MKIKKESKKAVIQEFKFKIRFGLTNSEHEFSLFNTRLINCLEWIKEHYFRCVILSVSRILPNKEIKINEFNNLELRGSLFQIKQVLINSQGYKQKLFK